MEYMVCNFFHVHAQLLMLYIVSERTNMSTCASEGGWQLTSARGEGEEGRVWRRKGENGGGVTWEEGGCTKLEAATLPALTWDGTFKHGFLKRLLLFLHLNFKRPSSPLIILFCFQGFSTNVSRRPLATPGFNLLLSWSHLQREAPPPRPPPPPPPPRWLFVKKNKTLFLGKEIKLLQQKWNIGWLTIDFHRFFISKSCHNIQIGVLFCQ